MEKNISILFIINLCISLWKNGNCIENRTACFTIYNGVCIKLTYNCPFHGGIDMKNETTQHNPLCPQDRHCCVPPENKDRFNYKAYKLPQCGTPQKQGRVSNGFRVNETEYPWHVALLQKGVGFISCGGNLIDPSWILTAAHCFMKSSNVDDWLVFPSSIVYEEDIKKQKEANVIRIYKIKKIISHNAFSSWYRTNDIALVELHKPVPLDVICLPNENETFDDMVCTSSGWGRTETKEPSQEFLQIAVPIIPLKKCQDFVSSKSPVVNEKTICGGYEGGVYQNCAGDGGGALVCRKKDASGIERHIVAGLVSYGQICGLPTSYFVYTNVSNFIPWIKNAILNGETTAPATTISCNLIIFVYFILNFFHFVLFY